MTAPAPDEPAVPGDPIGTPGYLRPPRHPRLVRGCYALLVAAVSLLVLGGPVWFFMHGTASGWTDERVVTVRVPVDAECRTGPPPGRPLTCEALWDEAAGSTVEGEVSDRYGGPAPEPGDAVEARVVDDGLAFTGYQGALLWWALTAPYLAVAGLLLGALAVAGLLRLDPRWSSTRTDLPPAERARQASQARAAVRTARATPATGRRRSAAPRAQGSRAAGGSGRHSGRRRAPRRRRGR